ncbi:hypothetical protein VR7878_01539 [Vibrio ruber DSM 16370]|uniref:Uncharacterized protein n=1 Tax=Vibrio ruber (strain DSM 16370 / JCM 11486 / BCRC 17186 / CECT 7878 / LMG 23124 / VR1) TaxID=1123498 RepID=A0A1R4LHL1_VIBR1|nr:hypothetical protein [Vibrio ruber]SJN55995.1 hypothetical protein VR7878_01539 [Vibrio ruber DSM 16370]
MESKNILEANDGLEESLNTLIEDIEVVINSDDKKNINDIEKFRMWLEVVKTFFQNGNSNFIIPSELTDWINNISKAKTDIAFLLRTPNNASQRNNINTHRIDFVNQVTALFKSVSLNMAAQGLSIECLNVSEQRLASQEYEKISDIAHKASESLSEIQKLIQQTQANYEKTCEDRDAIEKVRILLIDGNSDDLSTKDKVENLLTDSTKKSELITEAYSEVCLGNDGEPSIFNRLKDHEKKSDEILEKTENNLTSQEKILKDLRNFYVKIYGENVDDNITGGLDSDINDYIKKLDSFEKEQKNKYNTLNNQIESLIPGATNTGLASAYRELKEECNRPVMIFTILFFISIVILCFLASIFVVDKVDWSPLSITFVHTTTWTEMATTWLKRLPLILPILWLTVFVSKRRSEYQRLRFEYSHKESLAKSYNSYKQQIEELGEDNSELLKTLLEQTIIAIAFNASTTLDKKHSDGTIAEKIASKTLRGAS